MSRETTKCQTQNRDIVYRTVQVYTLEYTVNKLMDYKPISLDNAPLLGNILNKLC